jgi:hypothetical protein
MTPSGIEAATLQLEAQCLSAIYNACQFNTCQQVEKNKTFLCINVSALSLIKMFD